MVTLVRSDGKTFEYGDLFRIYSEGLSGVGYMEVELFTSAKALGDGDDITGQRIKPRTITINAVCRSRILNDSARRTANSFFNPRHDYTCHIDYNKDNSDETRRQVWIPCRLQLFDLPTKNIHKRQKLNVELFCPDPIFYGKDDHMIDIAEVEPRLGYPYLDNPDHGRVASVYKYGRQVSVENVGDYVTYPKVRIIARGEVVNPQINVDDLFVRAMLTMAAGDEMIIDFGGNTVTMNGENIIQRVSKDSGLVDIGFPVGTTSRVSYGAEAGETAMSASLTYYDRYGGV